MAAYAPLRDWGNGLLLLAALLLTFSVGFAGAQLALSQVSERNFPFAALAPAGIGFGLALAALGVALRMIGTARRHPREPF